MELLQRLSQELKVPKWQIESAVRLLDEGNTIPFIARYRKEVTGGLDDTVLRNLEERLGYLRNLEKRKEEVAALIQAGGKLDEGQMQQMRQALERAELLSEVEDLYRPYKQKRRTRASMAREKGLEDLANFLMEQRPGTSWLKAAERYVNEDKGVADVQAALDGAKDILAEDISDSAEIRAELRDYLLKMPRFRQQKGQKKIKNTQCIWNIANRCGQSPHIGYWQSTEESGRKR